MAMEYFFISDMHIGGDGLELPRDGGQWFFGISALLMVKG
jgi:hypothetical protein